MGCVRWTPLAARFSWWLFAAAALVAVVVLTRQTVLMGPYRVDADVYRQGAQTWLDGRQLYGAVEFRTAFPDYRLPFTYPPLSAIVFAPMTWTSLHAASTILTVVSAALLVASTAIVLAVLGVWRTARPAYGPRWMRIGCLAAAVVAAVLWLDLEPVSHNFACGQINIVLMTLVLLDCLPRRGIERFVPRGILIAIAIAIKLTPAVFLLYFVLRRDLRAVMTAVATFAGLVAFGFALAPRDSWEYWTDTVRRTDRIGKVARESNQSLAGMLARLGLTDWQHMLLWVIACLVALALMVWAARWQLRDGDDGPLLALMCVAVLSLLVSPMTWSHHWVWSVPIIVAAVVTGVRRRSVALLVVAAAGLAVLRWKPSDKVINGDLTRQVLGSAYVWWGLAFVVAVGLGAAATAGAARLPSPESSDALHA
ncbi:MAG: glycosyltransferase 87 family protein [Mycobacterium sp.]